MEAEMRKPCQTAIYAAGVENLLASLFMMEEFMKWRAVVEGIEVPPVPRRDLHGWGVWHGFCPCVV